MHNKPCDQLGTDLLAAQTEWQCSLDPAIAESVIGYINRNYNGRHEFEELLEMGLNLECITDDDERHAYKKALGLFYSRRRQYAREQAKERDAIPFAPR